MLARAKISYANKRISLWYRQTGSRHHGLASRQPSCRLGTPGRPQQPLSAQTLVFHNVHISALPIRP